MTTVYTHVFQMYLVLPNSTGRFQTTSACMILLVYPTKYVTVSGCIIRSKLNVHARHRFATSTHQTAAPFEDLPLDGIAGRLFFLE